MAENAHRVPVEIDIDLCDPDEENPNQMTEAEFNLLVGNIREIAMVEPIMVRPKEGGRYGIISGAHRWEACKVVGYKTIPAYVMSEFDEDMAKFQMVRMNMIRGKLDPVRFTKLYTRMAEKYGAELVKQAMGFADEKAFQSLYVSVRSELPAELKEKLDESKSEIKNIDDLSRILNELFSTYGDTLAQNFMVFTYGGRTHLWVLMNSALKKLMVDQVVEELKVSEVDINAFFDRLLRRHGEEVLQDLLME